MVAGRPDPAFAAAVARLLARPVDELTFAPLAGGISSDIWRVDSPTGTVCAKRALPKLRVADDWRAPVHRNAAEVAWFETTRRWVGERVAQVVAADSEAGVALLAWYEPERWRNWKTVLLAGERPAGVAALLGETLGRIHESARREGLAEAFPFQDHFDALRIDPYFRHVRHRHRHIDSLIKLLEDSRETLVHGDFSPKNILVQESPAAIRILDAETATWGCAAFDPAFLINHLLLKRLHLDDCSLLEQIVAFWQGYAEGYAAAVEAEREVCALVAGLMLARVHGKSPAEYLSTTSRARVEQTALNLLDKPPETIQTLITRVT